MDKGQDRSDYLRRFEGKSSAGQRHKGALAYATDLRKFEIELYWRRSAYFWAFIAATFASYILLQRAGEEPTSFESKLLVTCLGFVFSFSWYLVNRGSKCIEDFWTYHINLLEDECIGPITKTDPLQGQYQARSLIGPYPFSVTRINLALSLFIAIAWLYLVLKVLWATDWGSMSQSVPAVILPSLSAAFALLLLSRKMHKDKAIESEIPEQFLKAKDRA